MQPQSPTIDNEELVHNAARQGHVISLEVYLNQNPQYINKIFTYDKNIWTPLLAACFYKHEHVVRMLLTRFKADIEAVGEIVFSFPKFPSQLVKEVSPLWVAVAVDHFSIVKFLIEHGGANVKHLTEQYSTTFRIACYNNNLDMARYLVEHGADPYQAKKGNFTNLMLAVSGQNLFIISYLLDELKCDVNEQDENGQTALYHAVKLDSVDIVKILLEHGALNIRDQLRKVTPLMRAALYGKISVVDAFDGYCSDLEWIEAKELLAANLAGCLPGLQNRNKTIEYLTEAFELRTSKNLPKLITAESLELFNYRRECETVEQFNQFIPLDSTNALNIEVTLIHQRLLGDMSNDYHHVLRYNGYVQAGAYQYNDCLRWWFYTIDLKQKHDINLKKEDLREFVRVFEKIRQKDQMTVPVNSLLRILKIVSDELLKNKSCENADYNLHTLLYLITIAAQILYNSDRTENQEISVDDRRDLLKSIRCLTRYPYRTTKAGSTLLHLSCSSSTMTISLTSR
jgi:ankyrin repeat protein